jgi:hypothetical protein
VYDFSFAGEQLALFCRLWISTSMQKIPFWNLITSAFDPDDPSFAGNPQ